APGAPVSPADDSSPTANVLATCGVSCERAGPPALTSPWGSSASAKMSTLSAPCKNLSTSATCSESPYDVGTAVFAAARRWEWTKPLTLPKSPERTSGMWQSTQFCGLGG